MIIRSLDQQGQYGELAKNSDTTIKSKCWNDNKISAHHAIIPTSVNINIGVMSDEERLLYDLICRRYLMQFYPAQESDQTHIVFDANNSTFVANGRVNRIKGWKIVEKQQGTDNDKIEVEMPALSKGDSLIVVNTEIEQKITKPPAHYTEGTLIDAMENIGNQVDDPTFKKLLKV